MKLETASHLQDFIHVEPYVEVRKGLIQLLQIKQNKTIYKPPEKRDLALRCDSSKLISGRANLEVCVVHMFKDQSWGSGLKRKGENVWMCGFESSIAYSKIWNGLKSKLPQDPWRYLTVRWYLGHLSDFPGSLFLSWFSFSWRAVNRGRRVRDVKSAPKC